MAKKKPDTDAGLTPVQTDDIIIPNQEPASADAGLVLTAIPQTPAAADAREELLKAIASEATAISTGKEKGKSAAALEALARAYTLVATGQPATGLTAAALSSRSSDLLLNNANLFVDAR